ncbi:MAG: hypothetical protein R3B82_26490 [Sandaracinaceae bacterium]
MGHRTNAVAAAVITAILLTGGTALALFARDYGADLVRHQAELRECAGTHRGTVTLELRVDGGGRLEGSRVVESSSPAMGEVGACVLRRARGWTFQSSSSGAMGQYLLTAMDDAVQVRRVRPTPPPR